MNCFDLANWHPGCSVDVFAAGSTIFCWCSKHRMLANVQTVSLPISPLSSFSEDPKEKREIVAQPTKGIPGYEWKGSK